MAFPALGVAAPQFSLPDSEGQSVSLQQFQGRKVLVYFYPRASTPGCTVQACGLRDSQAELAELGVVTLGISPDSPARLRNFRDKQSLNFTLLGDEDHAVAEAYGVWGEKKFMGKVSLGILRTSFLIDEQGRLIHIFDKFKTSDHHQVVLTWLQAHA